MEVQLSKKAEKYYLTQDRITRKRLKLGLLGLEKEPPDGNIVPIVGKENTYRLRVGNFRVLYEKHSDKIRVTNIDSRGQIYK